MTLLRSAAFQLCFYLWTTILAFAYLPALIAPRRVLVVLARIWCAGALFLLARIVGLGFTVEGRDNLPRGPVIIAAKHQSAWDTLVLAILFRDPAIVVKRELFMVPFFGWYLGKHGMIAVDRRGGARALKSMVAAARAAAAAGRPIVVFPEGTRTAPGTRRPYQPGVAALYRALEIPVVPVALNSGLFWARRAFEKRPGRITLAILPPIAPGLPRRRFLSLLEARIEARSDALAALAGEVETTRPAA
jgi:1-acyl-sn-glycerol-3-phosphate acyltransferase